MPDRPKSAGYQVAAVVIAAGASRRLGQPKQLVAREGRSMLAHTIAAAVAAGADPVMVVLGAQAEVIRRQLPALPAQVEIVEHTRWADGMGTSIACGVRRLLATHPTTDAGLILVCDQPQLNANLLQIFLRRAATEPEFIWVADYGSNRGPPVLFPRAFFAGLLALQGDRGARTILRQNPERVRLIPFPGGAIDLDTPEDLRRQQS